MELKLEHVLLLLLFVFLFSRCNRLTEGNYVSYFYDSVRIGTSDLGQKCSEESECQVGGMDYTCKARTEGRGKSCQQK